MKRPWQQIALLVGSLLIPPAVLGQPYDLDPQKWYPLEVGNAWHYKVGTGFDLFVHAERDTLVDGARWILICEEGISALTPRWLRFTEDHYVLKTRTFTPADIDTLWTTRPRSIFTVNIPYDSSLRSPRAESATRRVGFADVFVDTTGSNFPKFKLKADLGFNGEVFSAFFLYEIGFASDFLGPNLGGLGLYAAIIDSVEYRDVSLLKSFLLSAEDGSPPEKLAPTITTYPNPFVETTHLSFSLPNPERVTLHIVDILGRVVAEPLTDVAYPSGTHNVEWKADGMASGVYLARPSVGGHPIAIQPMLRQK